MQILFPTQCITGGQVYSGYEHIPTAKSVPIAIFYQLFIFIEYPILLGGFKLGDEILDLSGLGATFLGIARMETSSWMTDMNNK